MYTSATNINCYDFRGVSTDTKPIGLECTNSNVDYYISNGSSFLEIDTSDLYMLSIKNNIGTWVKI